MSGHRSIDGQAARSQEQVLVEDSKGVDTRKTKHVKKLTAATTTMGKRRWEVLVRGPAAGYLLDGGVLLRGA
jgi:hypothetical protein